MKKIVLIAVGAGESYGALMSHYLEKFDNVSIINCETYRDAKDYIFTNSVDLLICNNRSISSKKEEWGVNFIKEVRAVQPTTKILFMKGSDSKENHPACDEFFSKPFPKPEEINTMLQKLLAD